jgi:hypothetical protein
MRLAMLVHFCDYLPYARNMLSFALETQRIYSIIKSMSDISAKTGGDDPLSR